MEHGKLETRQMGLGPTSASEASPLAPLGELPFGYYKILNGFEDIRSDSLFTRASYLATRGHHQKLYKQDSAGEAALLHKRVINDWNSLPAPVVCAKNVIEFTVALDCYWKSHPARNDYKFEW